MSTRAQVIVKGEYGDKLWFYRHEDGDPEGTMPTLEKFLSWVKEGRIRNDVEHAAGWLVLIGHKESIDSWNSLTKRGHEVDSAPLYEPATLPSPIRQSVGTYRPCPPVRHGDIEHLYTVDLAKLTIKHQKIKSRF